jgi:hypothetical protein
MLATGAKTGRFPFTVTTEVLGASDSAIVVAPSVGGSVQHTALVSGASKTPPNVPSPHDSACGGYVQSVRSYDPESFGYVEVKNPGDVAASVAVSLDGQPDATLAFFAYASPNAPASIDQVKTCMVSNEGEYVGGNPRGPELSSRQGSGLVVPAHGSAYVMLATGGKTGAFPLIVKTEAVGAADKGTIVVPAAGVTASQDILVSGASKTPPNLPSPRDSSCGGFVQSVRSYDPEAFAYIEVKNTEDAAAAAALSLDGAPDMTLALFAYASSTPPASSAAANACMVSDSGDYVGGVSRGPELSSSRGTSLIVPAHGSAYVMLATGPKTGPYQVKLVRE